ncbi:Hypothetical predicted protein [Cloeon dipterum]|uniref:Cyclic AMP-dependent transcription factor ATF-2 n=1 Tax=Cloeon dipterum TaxID=197152 RepID=A0A8S1CNV7_9INSE|nr:Hypothetical predicted protein [Cloeon dipterum]
MTDPEKPFVCTEQGCGMTFTNEDHLTVHKKKHEMSLSIAGKSAFVDQTPTPTRFYRYGEEVGLFQDLQNVNPFEEQFKKAAEAVKMGDTPLQPEPMSGPIDDTLHTPQVMPLPPVHLESPEVNNHSVIAMSPILSSGIEMDKIVETMEEDVLIPPVVEQTTVVPAAPPAENTVEEETPVQVMINKDPSAVNAQKYLPLIQLPDGRYVTMAGEPVQPSNLPSVVIQCAYTTANPGSVIADDPVPAASSHIPVESVSGPSTIHILPKPSAPIPPPKISLAKEKLKEKVSRKRVTQTLPTINQPVNQEPAKPSKANKTQISKKHEDDKTSKKLERNRAAAARFRKKKKNMENALVLRVQVLEEKIKDLQNENRQITSQMTFYRTEAANAKDLLLAHRDCSVTRQMNRTDVIAVVDSSTQNNEVFAANQEIVDSTGEISDLPRIKESITVRRASTNKAPSLTPLMIIRRDSEDGGGVLRYCSSDTVIVENFQRANTD